MDWMEGVKKESMALEKRNYCEIHCTILTKFAWMWRESEKYSFERQKCYGKKSREQVK